MSDGDGNDLIKKTVNGDMAASEELIRSIQDKVYSLCLRMLWQQEDAQDSCQEILLKVITRLSQFGYKSKFETWVFQIAFHHIIDKKRASSEAKGLTFSAFEEDLLSEQISPSENEKQSPDFQMQLSEIRLSCTTALLQCLEVEYRMAYILGEIFEMEHQEAASILGISTANFRKRLERARDSVENFTGRVCGVISSTGKCQCERRLSYAKSCGRVNFISYPFRKASEDNEKALDFIKKIHEAKRTAAHYRLTGNFKSPQDYIKILNMLT